MSLLGIELMIEHHLRKLLAEQRKQLDAIKKATNYDSTRKLIELYDEHTPSGSPSPQRQIPVPSNPVTPVRQPAPVPGSTKGSPATKGTPRAPGHLVGVGGTPQGMSSLISKADGSPWYTPGDDVRTCRRPSSSDASYSTCPPHTREEMVRSDRGWYTR
jgi:hypothetical protein